MEPDVPSTRAAIASAARSRVAVGQTNPKGSGVPGSPSADQPDAEVDGLRFIGVGLRDAADVAHVGAISIYPVISRLLTWYGVVSRNPPWST